MAAKSSVFWIVLVLKICINLCLFVLFSRGFEHFAETNEPLRDHNVYSEENNVKESSLNSKLKTWRKWEFAEKNILLDTFPVDKETGNFVRQVRNVVFSIVYPTPLKKDIKLVAVSPEVLSEILDLEDSVVEDKSFVDFVSGNDLPEPYPSTLAHRYGGHQFGYWSGQLGDGRALLLGQYVNRKKERWELQLKGSGKTPYSRQGDGRAVLRSSVREFLASEAMFHLGIPTSRAASLVMSSDWVIRDQFYDGRPKIEPAAVVLRLAQSWFRIGSLEILADNHEYDLLRKMVDFMIQHHFPYIPGNDKYLDFLLEIVSKTAEMIAKWQAVGFTHGVCNTDNFSLLSITIDYGPFGFLDEYNPSFIPNISDDEGRYSYKNQPAVGKYNMEKLREALLSLFDKQRSLEVLNLYDEIFHNRYLELFQDKLGLLDEEDDDSMLIESFLWLLESTNADFTMSFRELSETPLSELHRDQVSSENWSLALVSSHSNWNDWVDRYTERINRISEEDHDLNRMKRMQEANPRYILRNWMAQSAINKATQHDFSEVHFLHNVLKTPFTKQIAAEGAGYALPPPPWAKHLRVSCSS